MTTAITVCPDCDEPLKAVSDTTMACGLGCPYERPLNPSDQYDSDAHTDAAERYWMAKWE